MFRDWLVASAGALLLAAGGPAAGAAAEAGGGSGVLRASHDLWLETVAPLLTETERARFEGLEDPAAREAFIEAFWRSRDPSPGTAENELRGRWERNAHLARDLFGGLGDDRARALALTGARPQKVHVVSCPALAGTVGDLDGDGALDPGDLRVWVYPPSWVVPYDRAAPLEDGFSLVLVERCVAREGPRCAEVAYRVWVPADRSLGGQAGEEPAPALVERLRAAGPGSGCVADDAVWEELATALRTGLGFPSLMERLGLGGLALRSDGWIDAALRDLRPAAPGLATLRLGYPAGVGEGTALEGEVEVSRAGLEAAAEGAALVLEGEILAEGRQVDRFTYRFHPPVLASPGGTVRLPFHRSLAPGGYGLVLRLYDAAGTPLWHEPREIAVPELAATRAPEAPERARPAAAAQHAFLLRLLEPVPRGDRSSGSLRVRAALEQPEDSRFDRLELYFDDALAATLYQPPFVQALPLPSGADPYFVRAVAYLADGRTAEDTVFLHGIGEADEIEVELVELYATVLDRAGRPVRGLTERDFTALDEGEEQPIHRFQTIDDVPVHVGLLMDVSDSMAPRLDQVRESALRFFGEVLRPGDEAAVLAFNHRPRIVAAFTEHTAVLESSMVGLAARGGTALYDSLVFSFQYLSGLPGKRALVVLSDGEDLHSEGSLSDALDYAHRIGVAVYPIAIGSGDLRTVGTEGPGLGRRLHKWTVAGRYVRNLRRLAQETGGRYFAVESADDLDTVYRVLEEEIRSQYLVTYHVPPGAGRSFRRVELRVADPELTVHTMGGYYP